MDNNEKVLERTLESYELANEALLNVWNYLNDREIDMILEKQQNRLEQIAQRAYHEEKTDNENELFLNTLERYELANRHLYEHWDTIPFGERINLLQKQWNRLQEMRSRITR
ncbi:hypothetical protein [Effusibacillus dendaii]|uniref:Uncharacterized protein n=1 Tax=Effusibacillus dendaii TaxID=2743772 RepID=A0A7I8DE35_9BACL|nr:hypothetical protein [Effusibacillus dendaii]BCJ87542.1 hypothetical protein skT53_25270 [Effusibacillus dendaii]